MLKYTKISSKTSSLGSRVQSKSSIYYVLKSIKRFKSQSTQQNIIFQHYYQSYCDYLLKMGRMDEQLVIFEQLTVSDFKKWSSTALKVHSQVWDNFWKLKALQKCFLFHLKSSSRSHILIFVLNFRSRRKTASLER